MPADVRIYRYTGVGPAASTRIDAGGSGTTRASTSDSATPGSANPIPIPGSGTNYSFWVVTAIVAATTPSSSINNVKWYTDGSNSLGTGVTLQAGTSSSYVQANGTAGTTGVILTSANYTGLSPSTPNADNAYGFVSGANAMAVSGSIANPNTGKISDYVVYQYAVGTSASAGTLTSETFTWQYDEV